MDIRKYGQNLIPKHRNKVPWQVQFDLEYIYQMQYRLGIKITHIWLLIGLLMLHKFKGKVKGLITLVNGLWPQ